MSINRELLAKIADGSVSYISAADGMPLVQAGYVEVNKDIANPANAAEVACRITEAGTAFLSSVPVAANPAEQTKAASNYQIMTNIPLPAAKKRGNTSGLNGAVAKYPFADLPVGGTFFSANTEHKKGDAVKALGSTVSAQNDKYSEDTAEMKSVTRAVRDPQTKKAQLGSDGKKVTETVQLPVKKYTRKFAIRPVKAGEVIGSWTVPADGALVGRTV